MTRRNFMMLLGGSAAALPWPLPWLWPLAARAQNPAKSNPAAADQIGQVATLQGSATVSRANAAAAIAEANKRSWPLNIAVVDSGGSLVSFARMDGAQLASIAVSQHKARAAAKFRRPTKVFEDAMQKGFTYIETIDGIIASRGGIPLVEDGKLIGAIGCSGGTGSQDEVVCTAGAATINK